MTSPEAGARRSTRFYFLLVFLALIAIRLVLLGFAPHDDPSESRYAEIARKMVETGDWITPQFDYGVPFWAKPPLSMWLSALGMELFGVNEFGSRIFIFVAALGVLAVVARLASRERDRETGWAAALLLMGMPLFFYCSAAVMTDLALLAGLTLAMAAFRLALRENSRGWGYLFFIALAVGLLAKGPLTLVLAGAPIGLWTLLGNRWREVWQKLPWLGGTVLMLAIAMPWYVLAERKTPGFLDYFLVGEHWKRFTVKGWDGDLYGSAHAIAPGAIWEFWLLGAFPWCLGFLALPFRKWRNFRAWAMAEDGRGLYLVLWMLCPLVFFTPARNIIVTYPLPALPATALLLADLAMPRLREGGLWRRFHALHPSLALVSVLCAGGTMGVWLFWSDLWPKHSERDLVRRYLHERHPGDRLVIYGARRYSAEFYLEGNVENVMTAAELTETLNAPGRIFLAMPGRYLSLLPGPLQRRFMPVKGWKRESLYVERTDTPNMTGVDPAATSPIGR